jgi:23S rRNA pseudouridine2605 synthase
VAEERLQKVLAAAGIASRRACEELIAQGRVSVNDEVATLGDKVDAEHDIVTLDGERINVDPQKVYLMLNKPRGVVTTADDPEGRPTVLDLVNVRQRVFPVGRLDQDTEGLLLLTNDGELANALMHPSYEVERIYVALVPGPVRRDALQELRAGVRLSDGPARPRSVRQLEQEKGKALLEIVMTEGRKREVRRLLGAAGLQVQRLARVSYGGVELGDLRQGKWRFLTQEEIGRLHGATRQSSDSSMRKSRGKSTKRQSSRTGRAGTTSRRTGGRGGCR